MLEKLMGLTDEEFMDSLMVASNIRKLGRMELLYTCVADLVSFLYRTGMDDLLGGMEHYYDPNDYNRVIYHSKSEDASDRIKQILADADKLLVECEGACDESSAYQLLVRVLKEQTVVEESGARRLKTKEDGAMGSQILQNPSDPDATYREKEGKQNRGYTANIVETVESMEKTEEPTVLITDGAYSGRDNTDAAAEKNIDLVTTDLFPKSADRAEIVVHFLTQNRANSGYLLFYMKFSRNIDFYGR